MKLKVIFSFSLCLAIFSKTCFGADSTEYNILDFGAKADGKTINTKAISAAIQKCSSNGGGTVIVPPGTYISGTIVILSNVDLHLKAGAVIRGSTDTLDYKKNESPLFNEGYTRFGLLYAFNVRNISITGEGELDGNGTYFMNGIDKPHMGNDFDRKYVRQGANFMNPNSIFEDGPVSYAFRPGLMIQIQQCENVKLTDVVLHDSPEWTVRLAECEEVNVRGVKIQNNPLIPNNDGIHCTNSRNIHISDCSISTGDDCIIISGFSDDNPVKVLPGETPNGNKTGFAENVTVTNCVLSSRSSGIRIGYGKHPIRNLVFSNLVIYASNRGIGVFSRDNSSIENVLFSNITIETRLFSGHWWGKGEPIHISAIEDSKEGNAGKIKNIRFDNILATAETGILVYGVKGSTLDDIRFDRIQLYIHAGKFSDSYGGNFDLRPAYPINFALFKHDIPGLYAQFVKNLEISDFELSWGPILPSYFSSAIEINNFENLNIRNFKGLAAFPTSKQPSIKLTDGMNAKIIDCSPPGGQLSITRKNVE